MILSRGLESLEPRTLMDGATGVITDAYTTVTKLVVVVRYSSDQAVDASTLGDNDIRLTGPNQYNRFGTLVQKLPQVNGDVIGVYNFASPDLTWDFERDNGAYIAMLQADTVRDAGGDGNAQAALRTFGLWFQSPKITLQQVEIPHEGEGTLGTFALDVDSIYVAFRYSLRYPEIDNSIPGSGTTPISVTGPNGWVGTPVYVIPQESFPGGSTRIRQVWTEGAHFSAPGGGWDFSDNGVYTIQLKLASGEVIYRQDFVVNISTPKAELVSVATSPTAMAVTVRYSASSGINLGTIGNGDLELGLHQINGLAPYRLVGELVGAPVRAANGSVTATYRFALIDTLSLRAWDISSITTKPGQVRAGNNQPIGGALLRNEPLPLRTPAITATGTLALARNAWDVEVVFSNPGGLIQTSTIGSQNLIVQAPEGRATRVSVVSVTPAYDGTLRVRYRITPQVGVMRLFNGNYTISLAPNSVSQGPLGYIPAQSFGTANMTFP